MNGIYIPLCIYFNEYRGQLPYSKLLFTFHYVSISTHLLLKLMLLFINLHSTMYLFQLIQLISMFHFGENLHSTMYLFQQLFIQFVKYRLFIYIPLCIYFNNKKTSTIEKTKLFTFHYVSISTTALTLRLKSRLRFTFHYVSISTLRGVIADGFDIIYIPLCIYFNDHRINSGSCDCS